MGIWASVALLLLLRQVKGGDIPQTPSKCVEVLWKVLM